MVIGGLGTVFGPLLGALVFLGLEEILKGLTEHWMVVFGPFIVIVTLLGNRGIIGLLQHFDSREKPAPKAAPPVAAATDAAQGAL